MHNLTYQQQRFQDKLNGTSVKKVNTDKGLPFFSKKRMKLQREYKKIVEELFSENQDCELKVPGICTGKGQGLDHLKKRGKYLLDKTFLKRSCNACNLWKEEHPKEAESLGISISKF